MKTEPGMYGFKGLLSYPVDGFESKEVTSDKPWTARELSKAGEARELYVPNRLSAVVGRVERSGRIENQVMLWPDWRDGRHWSSEGERDEVGDKQVGPKRLGSLAFLVEVEEG